MYLSLKNLSKSFNNKNVVNDLSLDVKKGEMLCLLGPSGCGKTTTLKIIGGFLDASSGEVLLDGENITSLPPEDRKVSTVFQSYALFPHMKVIENVIYGLKFQGYSKKEAMVKGEEYLKLVHLEEFKNKKIQELSGGQQQRVALARALIVNPKVLLLDEPLSNLDAKLREEMRSEIKEIQKKFNITMIFVTHDQEEALSMADKIAVMNNGVLEQLGSPEEIYNDPKNSFVLNFIGNSNIITSDNSLEYIRPEHITLSKTSGDFKGKIIYKSFMGYYTSYVVEANNTFYKVKKQNESGCDNLEVEDEVFLTINHKGHFDR